jgi:hypothetical protein
VADETSDTVRTRTGDVDLIRLLTGHPDLRSRLETGEPLKAVTPLHYPGRFGPVVVHVAPGEVRAEPGATRAVRISDGGDLLKSLEEQGMDLSIDMILSKTVFHVVKEMNGAGIAGGQVFLDSDLGRLPTDTWRFLQLVLEVIGLRHSKYKDALVRLSRRQEGPDLIGWPGG